MKEKIEVHEEANGYVLKDATGSVYGRYTTKTIANEAAENWNEYYAESVQEISA